MPDQFEGSPPSLLTGGRQVLLLIDWENLFYCLFDRFKGKEMQIEDRIKRLLEWIRLDLGQLLGGCGFVFSPEHMSEAHQNMCVRNGLKLIICPKRKLEEPKKNRKTGLMETEEDTVDETIVWFAKMMAGHPYFKIICMVTGDNDYVPMLEDMKRRGIKIALAPPTINSLARTKELINLVDRNPVTQRKMLLMLDKIAV